MFIRSYDYYAEPLVETVHVQIRGDRGHVVFDGEVRPDNPTIPAGVLDYGRTYHILPTAGGDPA